MSKKSNLQRGGTIPQLMKTISGAYIHTCNLSTWEAEAERPGIHNQPYLDMKFGTSLGSLDSISRKKGKKKGYFKTKTRLGTVAQDFNLSTLEAEAR